LIDPLDQNWGARMSEVQLTGDPSRTELREASSDRGCADSAGSSATSKTSLSHFGHSRRRPGSGPIALRRASKSCALRFYRFRREVMRMVPAVRKCAEVAGYRPSADIFVVSSKASAEAWSSSRRIGPRCNVSLDSRTRNVKLRCSNTIERGLKLCR
jgi:hypothetical protein